MEAPYRSRVIFRLNAEHFLETEHIQVPEVCKLMPLVRPSVPAITNAPSIPLPFALPVRDNREIIDLFANFLFNAFAASVRLRVAA